MILFLKAIKCDSSYLSKVCRDNKIAYGYKWSYNGQAKVKRDFSKRVVEQLDLKTGNVLNTFESLSAAARAVNGDSSYLSKVCRGIQKSSKGFGWRFKED